MHSCVKSGLMAFSVFVALTGLVHAGTVEYTNLAAFDSATTAATTFGFPEQPPPPFNFTDFYNGVTVGPATFTIGNSPTPGTPTTSGTVILLEGRGLGSYGVPFLGAQAPINDALSLLVTTAPTYGIAFDYGSQADPQTLSITLSTGDVFSLDLPSSGNTQDFIGFTSSDLITTVSFVGTASSSSDQNFVLTDFTLASAPPTSAPLPATLPLFAGGLSAIGLLGWRKKRKNAGAFAA